MVGPDREGDLAGKGARGGSPYGLLGLTVGWEMRDNTQTNGWSVGRSAT